VKLSNIFKLAIAFQSMIAKEPIEMRSTAVLALLDSGKI
jgi:hypothetical protein